MSKSRVRRLVLIIHIIAGVAVIGDVWGLTLMHLQALGSASPAAGQASFQFTTLMVFAGGVPFSLLSLSTGLILVLLGKWGLRQAWILIKLCLQLGILATGALFIAPILQAAPRATDLSALHREFLVLMAVQTVMLLTATVLAVFKPRWPRTRPPRRTDRQSPPPATGVRA